MRKGRRKTRTIRTLKSFTKASANQETFSITTARWFAVGWVDNSSAAETFFGSCRSEAMRRPQLSGAEFSDIGHTFVLRDALPIGYARVAPLRTGSDGPAGGCVPDSAKATNTAWPSVSEVSLALAHFALRGPPARAPAACVALETSPSFGLFSRAKRQPHAFADGPSR
jgi:hypothetical protein